MGFLAGFGFGFGCFVGVLVLQVDVVDAGVVDDEVSLSFLSPFPSLEEEVLGLASSKNSLLPTFLPLLLLSSSFLIVIGSCGCIS